ncbi:MULTISPECIES: HK97-gp10 family putative phage morphogenesis protein [Lactobacillus]|uniref:HK97 gp10 family phage protein n=1 Tax=Lactobacillus xujianguonis TaxID=2495899 RepID=A0A437SXX9_9LACO|nr:MULTISPECIES: HK97-gp10 family putative phage morphogenesis protein [Lactobacillus]RVU71783.1 HK97 gp10 family phage protein [Lactobacillus xujianguonis]
MPDLDEQLMDWYQKIAKSVELTPDQKARVTGAGAKVFAEKLKQTTPMSSENYDNGGRSVGHNNQLHGKKTRKTKHLRESITYVPGFTADKLKSGNTSVGFDSKYQAMVARFVNNGTAGMSQKEVKNMHFIEKAQTEAKNAMLEAEARELRGMGL